MVTFYHTRSPKFTYILCLSVLIPHKITVAEYNKILVEREKSKDSDRLDFLASGSEEEEDKDDESETEESSEEDSDIEEVPVPQKTAAQKTVPSPKKNGKVETVNLCESSSEEDFIILDSSKKKVGESNKNVIVL